jgi:hydrogenase expression/formation protein HypC
MCLGVPGRVVRWLDRDPLLASAEVEFGPVRKPCHMACVPDAAEGDYVLVHAGVALSTMDPAAAADLLAALHSLGETPEEPAGP